MANLVIRYSKLAKLLTVDLQTFLSTLHVRLYDASIVIDPATGNGQFTEVTDSGYAYQVPTFAAPFLNGSNQGETVAPALTWVMTHNVGDFTVYGWYATDPADGEWVMAQVADPVAIPITAPGQLVQLTPDVLLIAIP